MYFLTVLVAFIVTQIFDAIPQTNGIPKNNASFCSHRNPLADDYHFGENGKVLLRLRWMEKKYGVTQNRRRLEDELKSGLAAIELAELVELATRYGYSNSVEIEMTLFDVNKMPSALGVICEAATRIVAKSDLTEIKITCKDRQGKVLLRSQIVVEE